MPPLLFRSLFSGGILLPRAWRSACCRSASTTEGCDVLAAQLEVQDLIQRLMNGAPRRPKRYWSVSRVQKEVHLVRISVQDFTPVPAREDDGAAVAPRKLPSPLP